MTVLPERHDVAAAIGYCADLDLPGLWLLGWSFGTELALQWGNDPDVEGAILLSPPLRHACRRCRTRFLGRRAASRWVALVPEFDDYLRPGRRPAAASAACRRAEVIGVPGAKHLWVGERYVRIVLNEIVRRVNPAALPGLPPEWPAAEERRPCPGC